MSTGSLAEPENRRKKPGEGGEPEPGRRGEACERTSPSGRRSAFLKKISELPEKIPQ
jgi:hypothetical protein